MVRKWLSFVLAAALILSLLTLPAAAASGELDEAVAVLSGLGIVSGYSDGLYHPEDGLTRAQFCKLAILAEGHGDQAALSAYRSLFSDVSALGWAAPYIALAHEEGLMTGKGDGSFGPDEAVTLDQAVTVCLRLLGYAQADVGPFWPEDYIAKAQRVGLLEGLDAQAGQELTRGQAALLLYNLLQLPNAQGKTFALGLGSAWVEDAVVLDNDAEAADGALHTAWVYANGRLNWYGQSAKIDDSLVRRRGTLLLDDTGKVMGFLPDDSICRTVTAEKATVSAITDPAGNRYSLEASTPVILDGEKTSWSAAWYDLEGREVTLYYAENGAVTLASAADARRYEGTLLAGYYEDARPNAADPSSVTLLGHTFSVADDAAGLSALSVGEMITVSLNGSGEIERAWDADEKRTTVIAVLEDAGRGSLTHVSGLSLSVEFSNTSKAKELEGCLVQVNSSGMGKASILTLSGSMGQKLDVKNRTLGSLPLADNVKIYDQVGSAPVVEVGLEDILTDTVAADQIAYAGTNESGQVDVILLSDVTGDAYAYGLYRASTAGGKRDDDSGSWKTVALENSTGTTAYCASTKTLRDDFGGLAVTAGGKVAGFQTLTKAADVPRSAFDGNDYVVLDGLRVPISDTVQVYNDDTDTWTDLAGAKGYADVLTVYYSGKPGADAKVRVVVAGE